MKRRDRTEEKDKDLKMYIVLPSSESPGSIPSDGKYDYVVTVERRDRTDQNIKPKYTDYNVQSSICNA